MSSPVSAIPLFDDEDDDLGEPSKRPAPHKKKNNNIRQPDHEVIHYLAPILMPPTFAAAGAAVAKKSDHDDDDDTECSICLETLVGGTSMDHAVTVKACGHSFHQKCIAECLAKTMKCPNCRAPAGRRPQGPGPSGTMTIRPKPYGCPGFFPITTTIEIQYTIPRGKQKPYHDHPGQSYHSTTRTAYLPDNADGRALCDRLKYAFDHGLTFRIGTSLTTNQPNSVTWASVHHKTSTHGGPHGFPDDKYISNCNDSLDALHVPPIVNDYDGVDTINYTAPDQLAVRISLADALERYRKPPPTIGSMTTQGRSPSGTMTIQRSVDICPGFGITGCFHITYNMPGGTQLSYHPNPNKQYPSTIRYCYLPDNRDGIELLQRLKYAFTHGLIFDIGTSLTTGKSDQIIWSTIPHKTSIKNPGSPYSFPDSQYLIECHMKLDQAGVPHARSFW